MIGGSSAAPGRARGRLAIRRRLATTPQRLRLASALLVLSAIAFGVVGAQAYSTRRDSVESAETTERRLTQAVDISAQLSDAHATAAYSFLVGGPEPAKARRDYKNARDAAAAGVAALGAEIGTSARGQPEVRRITLGLPKYTGLIDSARANLRLGYPLGSAYLRRASDTMSTEMLPAARALYEIEAQNLTRSYRSGVSAGAVFVVALAAFALLALLAATQIYLTRTTRRIVNVRLALATALILALTAWIVGALELQRSALARAQSRGSDAVELLTAARILASRAQALESVALSARGGGGGEVFLSRVDRAFEAVTKPIPGLLRQAGDIPGRSTVAIDSAYQRYLKAHEGVVAQETIGQFTQAVQLAVVGGRSHAISTRTAADELGAELDVQANVARSSFLSDIGRAQSKLSGLAAGIPLLTGLCALLALTGVRQRLEEYR